MPEILMYNIAYLRGGILRSRVGCSAILMPPTSLGSYKLSEGGIPYLVENRTKKGSKRISFRGLIGRKKASPHTINKSWQVQRHYIRAKDLSHGLALHHAFQSRHMASKISDPLQEADGNIACSLQNPLIATFKLLQPRWWKYDYSSLGSKLDTKF